MRKRKELFCVCCPHCGSIVAKTSSTEYTENKCTCGRKVALWFLMQNVMNLMKWQRD